MSAADDPERVFDKYLSTILDSVEGSKVLLMDRDAVTVISAVASHCSLLQRGVILTQRIDDVREDVAYPCVVILRPTHDGVNALCNELRNPHYRRYYVVFTNLVDVDILQRVALADTKELVMTVEEYYLDFVPSGHLQLIPQPGCTDEADWHGESIGRMCQSLGALFLTRKHRPYAIRYRDDSKPLKRLADELSEKVRSNASLFGSFPQDVMVILCDRRDDPVTPLLQQWTYQAMVHELLDIHNGCVRLPSDDEVVLSAQVDPFFAKHQFSNWGDLCGAVKELVDTYKDLNNIDMATASLDDIKRFMERVPETRSQQSAVTRHTNVVHALNAEISRRNLLKLSILEQDIWLSSSPSDHASEILAIIADESTTVDDALRLVLLYDLRYAGNSNSQTTQLTDALTARGCPPRKINLVDRLRRYSNPSNRKGNLFESRGLLKTVTRAIRGMKDVENVFTQHTPQLKSIIQHLAHGSLPLSDYPATSSSSEQCETTRPRDIIVVMCGGLTYEEVALVHQCNTGKIEALSSGSSAMKLTIPMKFGGKSDRRESAAVGHEHEESSSSSSSSSKFIDAKVTVVTNEILNSATFVKNLLV